MKYLFLLLFTLLDLMAQDSNISVKPTYIIFPTLAQGSESNSTSVHVTNKSSSDIAMGNTSISGVDSSSFLISSDGCSRQVVLPDNTCIIQTKFKPKSSGIKSSVLEIPYGSNDQNLSVFLTNNESKKLKAKIHLPPTMESLSIPEEMNATTTYQLSFSAMGYHSGYKIMAVMFDCTGISSPNCGASYSASEKFYETELLSASSTTTGDWTYGGVSSTNFHYAFDFTPPATRADGSAWSSSGTPIVIRFYNISSEDSQRASTSISLVIPGGLSDNYYDTSGRKIQKLIYPSN